MQGGFLLVEMLRDGHLSDEGAEREGLRGTPGLDVVRCLPAWRLNYNLFH